MGGLFNSGSGAVTPASAGTLASSLASNAAATTSFTPSTPGKGRGGTGEIANPFIGGAKAGSGSTVKKKGPEYPDDNARPMPSFNDPVAAENLRNLRLKLSSQSGRGATDLSGSRSYVNNFLGGTG